MTKSIANFTFDKAKAGRILREYIEESPYSQRQIAPMVGMSEDMLSNVLRGLNKEISLERIFKICIVTGRPVCEFIREMLDGEDIDFRDQFDAICPPKSANFADESVPRGVSVRKVEAVVRETEVITEENPPLYKSLGPEVLAFLRADRAEQAQRTNEIHDRYTAQLIDQYHDQIQQLKDSRQITIDHYEDRVALLVQEHEKRITDLKDGHAALAEEKEKRYEKNISYLKAELAKSRRMSKVFGALFAVETIGILILFFIDALNHNVGWFRGFLPHTGNGLFDSLKS